MIFFLWYVNANKGKEGGEVARFFKKKKKINFLNFQNHRIDLDEKKKFKNQDQKLIFREVKKRCIFHHDHDIDSDLFQCFSC